MSIDFLNETHERVYNPMAMCAAWNIRLRDAFAKSGLQQKKLAQLADVPAATVSRLLSDRPGDVRLSTLIALTEALGLSVVDLFGESGATARVVTAYDLNPAYQSLVAGLERLSREERRVAVDLLATFSAAVGREVRTSVTPKERGDPGHLATASGMLTFTPGANAQANTDRATQSAKESGDAEKRDET